MKTTCGVTKISGPVFFFFLRVGVRLSVCVLKMCLNKNKMQWEEVKCLEKWRSYLVFFQVILSKASSNSMFLLSPKLEWEKDGTLQFLFFFFFLYLFFFFSFLDGRDNIPLVSFCSVSVKPFI